MLQKQPIDIPFAQGLQQKVDPWRVDAGHFIALSNSIFQKQGLLQKRNGYGALSALPATSFTYLSTVNDNLVALGNTLAAFSEPTDTWLTQGPIAPMAVSVLPLIRNSLNQIQCDSAIAPNGLVCVVYTEVGENTTSYKYAILDGTTGQNVVSPRAIPVSSGAVSGSPRVFLVGNYFVLVFTNGTSLQYVVIPWSTPATTSPNLEVAPSYVPSQRLSWDGVVANDSLYVAYDTTSSGQSVNITYQTAAGFATAFTATPTNFATPTSFKGYTATIMSVCADTTVSNPLVYLSWYSVSNGTYTAAVTLQLAVAMLPYNTVPAGVHVFLNLATAAQNGTCTVFMEIQNAYGYDSSIPTNFIGNVAVTPSGSPVSFTSVFSSGASTITASSATGLVNGMSLVDVTTPSNLGQGTTFTISGTTLTLSTNTTGNSASSPGDALMAQAVVSSGGRSTARSVGIASKAFIYDGVIYLLAAYQSPYQNTYFMINGSTSTEAMPVVTAKLAYENGGGYLAYGLPNVSVVNGTASVSYLYKDLIEASSTAVQNNSQQSASSPVYSQTGVNLAYLNFLEPATDTAEMATTLNFSGGFLWMYDGLLPVEQNFFLWPDSVEVTTSSSAVNITGGVTSGSNIITVGSSAGVGLGMVIFASSVPVGSVVTGFTPTTIIFGPGTATATTGSETITLVGNIAAQPIVNINTDAYYYQAVYEWTDNRGLIHRSAPSIPVAVTTTGTGSTYIFTVYVPTLRLTYKIASPVKITLYRWSAGQQTYYQVTSIIQPLLNDTTVDYVTFVDAQSDAEILGNAIIYTTGGVLEDVNAPATNIITTFDDRLWMVDAEDPNTWWYSKQVIEGTPVEMSDLLTYYVAPSTAAQGPTGPITAGAPLDDKLISFKKNAIYYTNGTGPDNTGANSAYSQPIFITSTVGCTNQNSIVFTDVGLMFQSDKGIWLLGRDMSTQYIGNAVENYNSNTVLAAICVPETNQVRFTLDNGVTLMYDYFFQQWATFDGIPGISSCIYEDLHTYINAAGIAYQETPGVFLDGGNPVLMSFTTSWLKLAGLQGYQRAYYFYLLGQYLSPHVLQLGLAYDYNPAISQAPVIRPDNYSPPGGTSSSQTPAGQQSPAGGPSQVEAWRVFLNQQRCSAIQLSLQEFFDPSKGAQPGAGFTLSGLQLVAGVKNINRTQAAKHSVGGG